MSLLLVRNTIGSKRRLWHFLVVFILHEKRLTSHLLIFRELNRPYDLGIVDDPSLVYQIDLVNTREKNSHICYARLCTVTSKTFYMYSHVSRIPARSFRHGSGL